ncbi:DUF7507 domain-containing protein [Rhodococcus sp. ACT016]|uniref:DUF7507 domain-containing protein n=1 Tax=Rhodococcus sp. ACT016 TaxID=3134808 RepID=UPI003D2A648A
MSSRIRKRSGALRRAAKATALTSSLLLSLTAFTAGLAAPTAAAAPQPTFTCDAYGYLFQAPGDGSKTVTKVDLATGATSLMGSTTRVLNGVGYNVLDNYIYGWDLEKYVPVRIGSDLSETELPLPAGIPNPSFFNTGDVDAAGHYWATSSSNNSPWYEIDYAPGSPTYGKVLASGTLPAGVQLADWTAIGRALYGIANDHHLWKFDMSTHAMSDLGAITGLDSATAFGALYADAKGYLYGSDNVTGRIFRVDPKTKTGNLLATGPASGGNDGARCATAAIPTVTVSKTVDGRVQTADQFTVGLNNAGGTTLTSATTSGTGTSVSTTDWPVSQGATYTITDALAAGSSSTMADYSPAISCTDVTTGQPVGTSGTGPWTLTVTDPHDYKCTVTNTGLIGGLSVVKSSTATDVTEVGQKIPYTFEVTNTGKTPVKDIVVSDTQVAPADDANLSPVSCPATDLAPGKSMTCSAEYTVSQADFDHGSVKDSAKATGKTETGNPVDSPPSEKQIPATGADSALTVVKSSTATEITEVGQKVPYTFEVKNTGNVTVSDVNVVDAQVAPADDQNLSPVSCPDTSVAPGKSMTCTAEYTVSQVDFDHGKITDIAKATGKNPQGDPVDSPESGLEVGVTGAEGGLTVVKSSTATAITQVGQKVPFSFEVTNTGNVTVKDIAVTDTQVAPADSANMSPVSCPGTELAPGRSMTCTAEYTVSQADFDHGSIKDSAMASGKDPKDQPVDSTPSDKEITASGADPALSVVKSSSTTEITGAGQKVPYSFEVTNTGNVTMKNITVTDTQVAPADAANMSPVSCPETSLAPGKSMTCTAEYTVSQADYDHGKISDAATASGADPQGGEVKSPESGKEIETSGTNPALTVVKSSTTAAISEVGQKVPYTFSVINTGNVTMSGITITDTQTAPADAANMSAISCPQTSLAPGASMDCTAEYTVSQADFDHGKIADAATASGTDPQGGSVTSPESGKEIETSGANPDLSVVKSSTATEITKAGQKIPYKFSVTNTGNVTATDVSVTDKQEAPASDDNLSAISCPQTSLAPGESMECTAEYTVSEADVKFGAVTDAAVATGKTVSGDPIESAPSEKTIKKKGFTGSIPGTGSLALGSLALGSLGLGSLDLGGSVDLPTGSAGSSTGSQGSSTGSTGTPAEKPEQPGNGNGNGGNGTGNGGNGTGNGNGGSPAGQSTGNGNSQSGNGKPGTNSAQGARIDSGAGAGESGMNTGLLAAGGVVLVAALAVGGVILRRRRNG